MSLADAAPSAARELIALTAISACVWVLFGEGGLSLALIYVMGYVGERLTRFKSCCFKLPTLAGMLIGGLVLRNVPGPWRELVSRAPTVWLSALRSIATAVIILRAGMSLDGQKIKTDLSGILALGFLPGIFEALVVMLMWKYMLSVSWAWGLMAGFLHAAVSPAVVIPAAIALQEQSLGTKSGVPTRYSLCLIYWYTGTKTDAGGAVSTQFTCFTGTTVQKLTQKALLDSSPLPALR